MTPTTNEVLVSKDDLNTIYEFLNTIVRDDDGGFFIYEENEDLFEEAMRIMRNVL
jgi:hypothetical protein